MYARVISETDARKGRFGRRLIFFHVFCRGAFWSQKHLVCGAIDFSVFFNLSIH